MHIASTAKTEINISPFNECKSGRSYSGGGGLLGNKSADFGDGGHDNNEVGVDIDEIMNVDEQQRAIA